jgi:hypothetical protein
VHKRLFIAVIAFGALACKNPPASYSAAEGGEPPPGAYEAQETPEEPVEESAEEPAAEPVKEVVKDPPYGERITARGKVDQVYGDQVFTMKAPVFQNDLLVVAPKGLVFEALTASDEVEVTGEVRKMVVSEAEKEFSVTFDNAVKVKWEERPFLVAEAITPVGKSE